MITDASSASASLFEPLAHLIDVALKDEQPIGIRGGRIAEIVSLAFAPFDSQHFREVVHFEHFEIRERQRFLRALLALSKAVHEAVDNGRLRLLNAPEEQRKVLSPPKRRKASLAAKHSTHLRIVEDEKEGSHE